MLGDNCHPSHKDTKKEDEDDDDDEEEEVPLGHCHGNRYYDVKMLITNAHFNLREDPSRIDFIHLLS